jgi:hypothetical protein
MNTRLSVSTIAYLAEQEKRDEEERARQEQAKAEYEADVTRQAELNRAKNTLPFSVPLAIEICERVSSGELLINMCADVHLPTVRRVTQWLRENNDFTLLYKESINDRLGIFEEEVIRIADDASRDFKEVVRNGRTVRVLDGDAIARAKLRVEVRLKHLRAYKPSLWNESSTLNVKSAGDDVADMSTDELERKIRDLEEKNESVKEPRAA